jgi:hypothetical protein
MDKVYTITMIKNKDALHQKRLVAICTNIQFAIDIVEANETDIYEETYTYAVIEEVVANSTYGIPVTPGGNNQIWYEWIADQYVSVERPKEFNHLIGFWG